MVVTVEKVAQMAMLYDFYGQLLTEKQQQLIELYYHHDLSLGEIAEEYGVSRQAVHDLLKRTERILVEYESKLNLVAKYLKEREVLAEIRTRLQNFDPASGEQHLSTINQLLNQLLD